MEMIPVQSSDVAAVGYDQETHTLRIQFVTGATYDYSGVPCEDYSDLLAASSKGKYLNARIKGHYPYARTG